jgi:hypothetical protein
MKSFKELLLESIAEYKMTVRFAGELSEEDVNRMERFLGKYGLIEISSVKTTPIAKTNIFFDKSIENTEVSIVDITTSYPMSADLLRQQFSDLFSVDIKRFVIHPEGYVPEGEKENDDEYEPILLNDYDEKTDDGEHYGRTFITDFLNNLPKSEHVVVTNNLSIEPKLEKAKDQVKFDDKPSKSVISGDEDV